MRVAAEGAIPPLIALMDSTDADVRKWALGALVQIAKHGAFALLLRDRARLRIANACSGQCGCNYGCWRDFAVRGRRACKGHARRVVREKNSESVWHSLESKHDAVSARLQV